MMMLPEWLLKIVRILLHIIYQVRVFRLIRDKVRYHKGIAHQSLDQSIDSIASLIEVDRQAEQDRRWLDGYYENPK